MEQSGIVGFDTQGNPERVNDLRDAPFCSKHVFAKLLGIDVITEDVVRGWIESGTVPTAKIGRHRVINLYRIRRDLDRGKTVFCAGDYSDE
ncbi:DNA-binding protein [Pseudomonas kuykendallii]|uniref:DNA-binding protein n=1 Tax=Pseudomonas kuykendallii TaxID=1007099 RepID=UPI0028D7E9C6|nr:DNA-binding protein [Pseudomonas kuykendallii]